MASDKRLLFPVLILALCCLLLMSCSARRTTDNDSYQDPMPDVSSEKEASEEPDSAILSMNLYIDGESVPVIWEENESVNELKELASTTDRKSVV